MNQEPHNLPVPDELRSFARELRSRQTNAEGLMWSLLRSRRFLKLKFRRQHPLDPYVLDFYYEALQWAVELDGGQHNSERGKWYDQRRAEALRARGVTVSRYWNHDVLGDLDVVLEDLFRTPKRLGA